MKHEVILLTKCQEAGERKTAEIAIRTKMLLKSDRHNGEGKTALDIMDNPREPLLILRILP